MLNIVILFQMYVSHEDIHCKNNMYACEIIDYKNLLEKFYHIDHKERVTISVRFNIT